MVKKRIIVGISGASGVMYGVRMLEALREMGAETHLVMSKAAELTLSLETSLSLVQIRDKADHVHKIGDISASIASGSYPVDGMVIAPCSIKTLGEIASVTPSSLLTRAADVTLKEHRRLVLMVRESPLHLGHLRAMTVATEAGAIICPPMPAFYAKPQTLDDLIDQSVGRACALLGLHWQRTAQWTGPQHG